MSRAYLGLKKSRDSLKKCTFLHSTLNSRKRKRRNSGSRAHRRPHWQAEAPTHVNLGSWTSSWNYHCYHEYSYSLVIIYTYIYICMYVCMYVYVCRYVYIYVYIIFPLHTLYGVYVYIYICIYMVRRLAFPAPPPPPMVWSGTGWGGGGGGWRVRRGVGAVGAAAG